MYGSTFRCELNGHLTHMISSILFSFAFLNYMHHFHNSVVFIVQSVLTIFLILEPRV